MELHRNQLFSIHLRRIHLQITFSILKSVYMLSSLLPQVKSGVSLHAAAKKGKHLSADKEFTES